MNTEKWTSIIVADRIREAAETLKSLPNHHPGKILGSSWPDYAGNLKHSYTDLDREHQSSVPSGLAIDRMDEVLMDWIGWLNQEEIKVIWSWVLGAPAQAVAKRLGIHRSTLHRKRLGTLKKLAVYLNSAGRPVLLADGDMV
jgi:hypothetical protein